MDEMSVFYRSLFDEINFIDTKLDEAINTKMCTDVCKCLKDQKTKI